MRANIFGVPAERVLWGPQCEALVVFACQHHVTEKKTLSSLDVGGIWSLLCTGFFEQMSPLTGVEKLRTKVFGEVLIGEVGRVVGLHEAADFSWSWSKQNYSGDVFDDAYLQCDCHSAQNHSLPKLGTENTPQCRKMPIFALSNHPGSGRLSRLFQLGSYLVAMAKCSQKSHKKTPDFISACFNSHEPLRRLENACFISADLLSLVV